MVYVPVCRILPVGVKVGCMAATAAPAVLRAARHSIHTSCKYAMCICLCFTVVL
jgi:hypothetical protein